MHAEQPLVDGVGHAVQSAWHTERPTAGCHAVRPQDRQLDAWESAAPKQALSASLY